jgi:hypothetical protein
MVSTSNGTRGGGGIPLLSREKNLRFFAGYAAKKWRLRRSRFFFREQASRQTSTMDFGLTPFLHDVMVCEKKIYVLS